MLFFVLDGSPVRSIFTSSWSASIETVGRRKGCFGSKAVLDAAQKATKTMLRHFGQACTVFLWRAAHVAY